MDTLNSLFGEISRVKEEHVVAPILVDVTEFFPGRTKENPVVFQWQSPSVRQVYLIGNDAAELLKEYMDMPETLALDVATLAWCHVAPMPAGVPAGKFYAKISEDNPPLFFALVTRLQKEFPHLKGSSRNQGVLVELCVQYLMRHPEELSHLPSEMLTELEKMAEAKRANSVVV